MRVALLCDVDQAVYHVGDEAIGIASAAQLRQRGHEVVMISRQEKYGPGGQPHAESIPALTFPWPLDERDRYLAEIRKVLSGNHVALPAKDKLFKIMNQLRGVDALVIGGGGSLNSNFGWLVYERLATALVASFLDIPVVLSGQSLGPFLLLSDRAALKELLELCQLVGVRDADSYRLATQLCPEHPAIFQTLDDAVLLDADWGHPKANRISVTLGDNAEPFAEHDYVSIMAALIDGLAQRTGAEVEFVPHMADPDRPRSDVRIHKLVAAQMSHQATLLPIEQAVDATTRLAASRWALTTRFHPVVFGLLSGTPVLPITLGRYARSRVDGALANWGQSNASVPFAALWDPATGALRADTADAVLDALVADADTELNAELAVRAERLDAASRWWDQVVAVLDEASGPADGSDAIDASDPADTHREAATPDSVAPLSGPAMLDQIDRFTGAVAAAIAPFRYAPAAGTDRTVALIMRTQNRPGFLDRAVQDVLEQAWADWQLVVVNDAGDTDQVSSVLDRYRSELGDRLTVVNNPVSHGMEAASNIGLANSRSELVNIHDDDDSWQPRFLLETIAHLRAHPDEEAVATRTTIVHEQQVGPDWVLYDRIAAWPKLRAMHLLDFVKLNRIVPICLVYRRALHDQIGPYDEDYPVIGDYVFHLRLLQAGQMGFIDHPLANWHLRPLQTDAGATGNSMYTHSSDHAEYDLRLRDRALKEWTDKNGLGLPMFISKELERETDRLEQKIQEVVETLGSQQQLIADLQVQLRAIDHAVRSGGGLNLAKHKYEVARGYLRRAAARIAGRL
ncbi:polysaccharide pyruvyl transferase family protein [Propionibacterium freudenreichii]|uniref:polysaccharide pyruvyl transferase family protein n=1 Tax=Propionibacterium freudenreichii TaxID=1744 RepID=UPI002549D7FB|nr:polysaccharide pyruvyl transferase family protein [Propionibacterium freudenreichii]MDK9332722.1 polysaccharide pyruvyl transferase family protein [Propionibacterium freudenreichii]